MVFFLVLFLFTVSAFGDTDYRRLFYEHLSHSDFSKMESILKDWESSCPEDPDLLAAYGSYFYHKAQKGWVVLPVKLTPRENIILNDPPLRPGGEPVGQIRLDHTEIMKAEDYWKKASQKCPWRLDFRLSLARLYQDLGDFEAQYQTLAETLQYVDKNRKKIRWNNDQSLPEKPGKFIPAFMQDYMAHYFNQQLVSGDEKAFRLAKLTITFFPNHPDAYNSMAAYYSFKDDWEHTLKYLLVASQKDPQDSLVLGNIGNTLMKLGKPKEAMIYYRKVIRLNNDEESVARTKKRLEEMGPN